MTPARQHLLRDLTVAASSLRTVSEIPLPTLLPMMGQAEGVLLADIVHHACVLDRVVKERMVETTYL